MGIISKIIGLVLPNKAVIVLAGALLASGYLLVNSYKANGKQSTVIAGLKASNDALDLAYNSRLAEFKIIQLKMIEREEQQKQVDFDEQFFRKKLSGVKNESCIDFDLGDDFASVFTATGDNSEGLPVD